jgi:deoxyribose-phosphate aldolase
MAAVDRTTLASFIDHTLLRPEATSDDIVALCTEANDLEVFAICVSPCKLPLPLRLLDADVAVAAVCGFPSGAHHPEVKSAEAAKAQADGANEIDVVIDLGRARDGDWAAVEHELTEVRRAIEPATLLKVIIESALLDDDSIVTACRVAESAGADFVKTSTGFHPAGGATVEAVSLMAKTVDGRLGVKASGGIRTTDQALAMINAGATRLGCSASRAILEGLP